MICNVIGNDWSVPGLPIGWIWWKLSSIKCFVFCSVCWAHGCFCLIQHLGTACFMLHICCYTHKDLCEVPDLDLTA